jgi:oligoribonuclease NrnB/cAMP/cGMP phosphodiesterase (DHH superfamily)
MCQLTWIDHHQTAISEARENNFIVDGRLAIGMAGCELTWRHLYPRSPVPMAVYLLGRYDVWDHSHPDALPFQYGMRQRADTRPDNQTFWANIFTEESALFQETLDDGHLLLDYENAQNEKFCRAYAFETNLNGFNAVCANRGFTNSKVFDSVYDPEKHHMMVTFCRMKLPKKQWTVSMYSTRDDVDCGAVAKSFGGGGHKGAAGFQCDELPFEY